MLGTGSNFQIMLYQPDHHFEIIGSAPESRFKILSFTYRYYMFWIIANIYWIMQILYSLLVTCVRYLNSLVAPLVMRVTKCSASNDRKETDGQIKLKHICPRSMADKTCKLYNVYHYFYFDRIYNKSYQSRHASNPFRICIVHVFIYIIDKSKLVFWYKKIFIWSLKSLDWYGYIINR